jgi:hypothetical protein
MDSLRCHEHQPASTFAVPLLRWGECLAPPRHNVPVILYLSLSVAIQAAFHACKSVFLRMPALCDQKDLGALLDRWQLQRVLVLSLHVFGMQAGLPAPILLSFFGISDEADGGYTTSNHVAFENRRIKPSL